MTKIAPSLLSSDFARLGDEIRRCEAAGAEYIHFDVMDGAFVPNLTIGPTVVAACRPVSKLVYDVHLMINRPDLFLDSFLEAGSDIVTIHVEPPCDVAETLKRIRAAGRRAGLSLRPGTPLEKTVPFLEMIDLFLVMSVEPGFGGQKFLPGSPERVREIAALRDARGLGFEIEVDGGIDDSTAPLVVSAGATVLVSGSHLFRQANLAAAVSALRRSGGGSSIGD